MVSWNASLGRTQTERSRRQFREDDLAKFGILPSLAVVRPYRVSRYRFCPRKRKAVSDARISAYGHSTPTGSRTPASGLRIRRPRPLDYGGKFWFLRRCEGPKHYFYQGDIKLSIGL